jgi:Mg-chelatase subunit ChlD
MRLSILVVDASLSTQKSSELVRAAGRELLRPIYTERERAALISCWGPRAEIAVDENTGRNIDLVAARLDELEPGAIRALTPLPEALELARMIAERFRRSHPGGEVDVAIFSDGRANVPIGGETMLASAIGGGDGARAHGALANSASSRANSVVTSHRNSRVARTSRASISTNTNRIHSCANSRR